MKLDHPDPHTFEQSLRQLIEVAFNSGVKAIESRGFRLEDIKEDETAMSVFIRGCHYGYDKAQIRIGAAVIAIEENIKVAKSQIKELRRSRTEGANEILERVRGLKGRQLILRRIVDTMVYSMLGNDKEWVIRRLGSDEIRPIDPKVLERM